MLVELQVLTELRELLVQMVLEAVEVVVGHLLQLLRVLEAQG